MDIVLSTSSSTIQIALHTKITTQKNPEVIRNEYKLSSMH
jgi:hypothetical protein